MRPPKSRPRGTSPRRHTTATPRTNAVNVTGWASDVSLLRGDRVSPPDRRGAASPNRAGQNPAKSTAPRQAMPAKTSSWRQPNVSSSSPASRARSRRPARKSTRARARRNPGWRTEENREGEQQDPEPIGDPLRAGECGPGGARPARRTVGAARRAGCGGSAGRSCCDRDWGSRDRLARARFALPGRACPRSGSNRASSRGCRDGRRSDAAS